MTYKKETERLFYARLLNKIKDDNKKLGYRGFGSLFEFFDSTFISFFPKKFNRFHHKIDTSNDFVFRQFDDLR